MADQRALNGSIGGVSVTVTELQPQSNPKKRGRRDDEVSSPTAVESLLTNPEGLKSPIARAVSPQPRTKSPSTVARRPSFAANADGSIHSLPESSPSVPPSLPSDPVTTSVSRPSSVESGGVSTGYPYSNSLPVSGSPTVDTSGLDDNAKRKSANYHDEEEHQAALTQAEEGTIVIDSDDQGTDDGYETDAHTAASTSLAESVRDYVWENGRRYHRFREGRYNFPNDDIEQQREDMKHAMVKLLCGNQLYFAPIGDNPHQILDIGTGTGIWAIEMGDLFPSSNILGIDLSPIQPEWIPPNVRFMVDDVESPWLHPRNYFDYVHSRHTVQAIQDWPKLMRRVLEHLRPGGWFELQEVYHYPISQNNSMSPDHPIAKYWGLISEGLGRLGVPFFAVANGGLTNMMRECGFVNVTERVLQIPIGTWPKNKVLKTVGLYWRTILLDGIQAIALGPLTRGLGWTREEVELFLVDVRRAYQDNSILAYMPMHIIYGQKPLNY